MNRNLHSPTQLTEFARDFDSEPTTFYAKFVNKITNAYNSSYNTVNVVPSNQNIVGSGSASSAFPLDNTIVQSSSSNSLQQSDGTAANLIQNDQKSNSASSTTTSDSISNDISGDKSDDLPLDVMPEERTPSSILHRISNLVALKNNDLTSYKDTELQRFWMPDSKSKECYECSQKFSAFRRKHHCRLCGQIFCSKCCNQVVPGKIINCSGNLKVCTYCSKIVLSYLKSSDINSDLKSDLQALQDDLSNKLSLQEGISNLVEPQNSQLHRKISVGYQEERLVSNLKSTLSNSERKNALQQSNSLKTLHDDMSKMLSSQNRGVDLIAYLITQQISSNKVQAIAMLSTMIEAGFLLPLIPGSSEDDIEFNENNFYKLLRMDDVMSHSGSYQLNLDFEASSVHLTRQNQDSSNVSEDSLPLNAQQDNSFGFSTSKDYEIQNSLLSTAGSKSLMEAFCDHEELLLTQLLRNDNLDQSWSKILLPLCARIANSLRPELCGMMDTMDTRNLMDIRNFINFKKVPGGSRNESKIIGGAVFTKNVVHKEMATTIENPQVLLLQCAIVYQRVEGKFVSIETLLLQEREYLRNVTARILSLKPNVVLVHKNVSGIAQDMLRNNGITLVLDVKLSVLERLSRCLKCDIVDSIDSNIGRPKLGTCDRFYIKSYDDQNGVIKTLMFLEIPTSPRGCCVLLRGGTNAELMKVKKTALLLLFARYNWRLELSFLLDEFARPPSPKPSIFDSKDNSPIKYDNVDEEFAIPVEDSNSKETTKSDAKLTKCEKKVEEKIVTKENVQDFSDPLRATDLSPSVFEPEQSVEFAVETPYDNRFKTALSSTVLSVSPFVTFPLPFLETEQGRKCKLRSFYPNELYYSKQWSVPMERTVCSDILPVQDASIQLKPVHNFLSHKITTAVDNRELQTLLANFRASGGRLPKSTTMKQILKIQPTSSPAHDEQPAVRDALDLINHQRLPVLFCSYYQNPKTTSTFCALPSMLNMIFYGAYDIMLGKFLEHYCFRRSYLCSSCTLPMLDHVRRYVHSMGCIQVKLTEDLTTQSSGQILMTSWCSICHEMTRSVPMSKDTWCLSFAKYLELRFHSHAYKRRNVDVTDNQENSSDMHSMEVEKSKRQCPHSLHKDHVQYFSYNGIVASFMYSSIEVWEIGMPAMVLTLKSAKIIDNLVMVEEIKNFALKGYDVYAKIYDKLALFSSDGEFSSLASLKLILNRDQLLFREKVGIVQTLLTEKHLNTYDIMDAMIIIKRTLAESIELWMPRLHEAALQSRTTNTVAKHDTHTVIDAGTICTEDLRPDLDVSAAASECETKNENILDLRSDYEIKDLEQEQQDKGSSGETSPIKNIVEAPLLIDKKSVKTILRELLPIDKALYTLQSPISSNEHYSLPLGQFPIMVHDQDLSSVIAFSLVSNEYKKALENMVSGYASDATSSPNINRRSQDGSIDSDDRDAAKEKEQSDKKSKSGLHIEVYFQDLTTQFTCKIYFARDFDTMRTNFIKPTAKSHSKSKDQQAADSLTSWTSDEPTKKASFLRNHSQNDLDHRNLLTTDHTDHGMAAMHQQETEDIRSSFARSLSESVRWEARGGKSGSKFCKTLDDRFVLKEMSKQDVAIFENFAPNYFVYLNQCLHKRQPTLLAKIFGVFKVTIKKKDSIHEKSVLIMENLFYNSEITNKFDLKGSDRNRLVDPTNQNGEIVLLDENLIQMSWSKPLYILSHSKTILRDAIIRDASFLEKNDVMDYSLLVGLNSNDKLLVLGIIDYIRTFTLDKRIESLVKQTGFLGGQGKLPTVISPKLYKQRFSEAMERYFLAVPDRWEGLTMT